jgi:CRP-like cAMP-binding protein
MILIMSALQSLFGDARERTIEPGGVLFRRDDAVRSMFLVRVGAIALERPLADGTALTLHRASEGTIVAEASLFAEKYHCDAIAKEQTVVFYVKREVLLKSLADQPDAALDLIKTQSHELQSQRARVETLRMLRVADRLDAWLELHCEPAVGQWKRVADEIGVSPPALYRELARRRRSQLKGNR